ncbi:hypothetical protein Tco_0225493, partial [Tanacetum coccineum]
MTVNKGHLEEFEEFKRGPVTFGGSKGYITSKGRIRVGNLDFDSVSLVKELGHFNLFSISQTCDKQHKVLFTETECLVVSSDFKMPDENQILLKVPKHHNMYSFDMKTPTPAKSFTRLIAKATSDESTVVPPTPPTTQPIQLNPIPSEATTIPPLSQPAPPTPIAETTTASPSPSPSPLPSPLPSPSPSPAHEPIEHTFEQQLTDQQPPTP